MQPGDLERRIACIIDAFPRAEPMTKALRITPDEFYPFAEMYCKKAINKGRMHLSKKEFIVGENNTIIIPHGIEHYIENIDDIELVFLYFSTPTYTNENMEIL